MTEKPDTVNDERVQAVVERIARAWADEGAKDCAASPEGRARMWPDIYGMTTRSTARVLAALKAGDVLPGGFVVRREDDPIREHEGKFLSEGAIHAEYAAKPQRIEATWAEMERRLLDQIKPYLRRSREPYDFGGGMKGVRLETWTRVFPPFPATKEPPHD